MLKNHPTLKFILDRSVWYFLTFIVATTINFFLPRLGEANPIDMILSKQKGLDSEQAKEKEEAYLKEFGLVKVADSLVTDPITGEKVHEKRILRYPADTKKVDKDGNSLAGKPVMTPMIQQYWHYIVMTMHGDLGTSFMKYPDKVNDFMKRALPWTIAIQLPTIILGWFIGNLLGALAAYRRGWFDKVLYPILMVFNSIPFFAVGMLLVYYFAEVIPLFPASGGYAPNIVPGFTWTFISSAAYYYVLPFLSIFPVFAAGQAVGMRSMGIYELGTGYVKYAKTLGIKDNMILMYIFRNAMLPQLTGLALQLGYMIGGALITEMIFSYPGLGMALLTATTNNDYPMIQGSALLVTITVLIANFSVDLIIGFFDPRVRAGMKTGA